MSRIRTPVALVVAALLLLAATSATLADDLFIRGDGNLDGAIDIGDPVSTLALLFSGGSTTCLDAHDANDDGVNDIADPIFALGFQFTAGPLPPDPFPGCGIDPTSDLIDCFANPFCGAPLPVAIHVDAASGDDANAGGPDDPVATIGHALQLADGAGLSSVLVAAGTYAESIALVDGISIAGGRLAGAWTPQPGVRSIVEAGQNGCTATGIVSPTSITGMEFRSDSASGSGASSIAMRIIGSAPELAFDGVHFVAGDGANGAAGNQGSGGSSGGGGGPGGPGSCNGSTAANGGFGGGGVCPGGGGGDGGPVGSNDGQDGSNGGCGGGSGGNGGAGGTSGGDGQNGGPGAPGVAGAHGSPAAIPGTIQGSGLYLPSVSGFGLSGTNGRGGGGGGGGGGQGGVFVDDGTGNGGGGGGGGGVGGGGAAGGQGGGASIAVVLVDASPTFTFCTLASSLGGSGGSGGAGGSGGSGGNGGIGASVCLGEVGRGGNGGPGGPGGPGGSGGGGPGGPSFCVWLDGLSAPSGLLTTNFFVPGIGGSGGASPNGGNAGPAGPDGQTN